MMLRALCCDVYFVVSFPATLSTLRADWVNSSLPLCGALLCAWCRRSINIPILFNLQYFLDEPVFIEHLLCVRHSSFLTQPCETTTVTIPIAQMRKMTQRNGVTGPRRNRHEQEDSRPRGALVLLWTRCFLCVNLPCSLCSVTFYFYSSFLQEVFGAPSPHPLLTSAGLLCLHCHCASIFLPGL